MDRNLQFGLKTEVIKKINAIFSNYHKVEEVIIYGSRAKGNYKPGSDIDLTIKGENINNVYLNKITIDLDELLTPYTFDLSIFRQIENPDLLDHIKRVGKIFFKAKA